VIGWLLVAQLAIVAQGPSSVASCAPFQVTVAARAPGTVAPRVVLRKDSPVQLLQASLASRADPDAAGHPYVVTEGTLVLSARGPGRVTLSDVEAVVGGERVHAASTTVEVTTAPLDEADPLVLVRAELDHGGSLGDADTLFVGEQMDYVVRVLLNETARGRLRRNPTFFPPDMPAVLAYDVAPPAPTPRIASRCFESLSYRRALFPLFAGDVTIPPATLTYALAVSPSFFSREEAHEAHTDTVRVVAVEPPATGRPADFAGAVGSFRVTARLDPAAGRMGDPLVLTVRVEGAGNVKLLPRPMVTLPWATVANGEERVEVDSTQSRVRGAKEFDWLLSPRTAGHLLVPAIRYPFFDPVRKAYELSETGPITLEVAPAALAVADTVVTPPLSIRRALRPPLPTPWSDRPLYWALLAIAPVPAALRRVRRVRRRAVRGLTAGRRLELATRGGDPVLARELRRLYLDALRERIPGIAPGSGRHSLARQLRRAGVTDATADRAEALLTALDRAAFAGGGTIDPSPATEVGAVMRDVDRDAVRPRASLAPPARRLLVVFSLGGASLAAVHAQPLDVESSFARAVRAYDQGAFVAAGHDFARVVARLPRAQDAWANLGTAAWAAHDSARAAAGWQRALRLDPLDDDVRTRLEPLQRSTAARAPGTVPAVPADAIALACLAIWIAAWFALAIPPTRLPAVIRPVAGGAIVLAALGLLGVLDLHDRLRLRDLAAVRHSVGLLDTPVQGARAAATAGAGEVGRLGARAGLWVRLQLDNDRAGWVPMSAVLPLESAVSD
jgi:hypothetical protein